MNSTNFRYDVCGHFFFSETILRSLLPSSARCVTPSPPSLCSGSINRTRHSIVTQRAERFRPERSASQVTAALHRRKAQSQPRSVGGVRRRCRRRPQSRYRQFTARRESQTHCYRCLCHAQHCHPCDRRSEGFHCPEPASAYCDRRAATTDCCDASASARASSRAAQNQRHNSRRSGDCVSARRRRRHQTSGAHCQHKGQSVGQQKEAPGS
jgi:hypothetical protein